MDVQKLIEFEDGSLNANDTLILFSDLVKSGMAYQLQGFYGRTAHTLIKNGWLDNNGQILKQP